MDTDPYLSRLIGWTVCVVTVLMVATLCWQALNGYEADKNIHDLTYIIVGGLVSQVTVHAVQKVKDGMQNVQVPAPLIPDDSLAAPTEVAVTAGDIHPDAPEESDL